MKRAVIIIAIIVLLIIAGISFRQKGAASKSPNAIETAKVEQKDFVRSVSSSGKTVADRAVSLRFQTSGRLAWVGVKEGDRVAAGRAIAGLDPREVQKNLEKALRDYSSQRNDFEELWRVTYMGTANPSTALNDTAKRILEKNQWDLEQAILDVELKDLALQYATLVTPIAGVVTHIDTKVAGVNITPAGATFEIVDPGSLVFEANIDEVDVGTISVGLPTLVSLDAFPGREFVATVSAIAYSAQISSGGATVFPVTVSFSEVQSLRVGFNGDVTIQTEKIENTLVVPDVAVRGEGAERYVYRKKGSKYEKVNVVVGPSSDDEIVITGGLSAGDEVVTRGFSAMKVSK